MASHDEELLPYYCQPSAQVAGQQSSRMMSNQRLYIIVATGILILFYYSLSKGSRLQSYSSLQSVDQTLPRQAAANATLGFSTILALSAGPSWRSRGLAAAARLTGLAISTPIQPPITAGLLTWFENFGLPESTKPPAGSAKAWLAHLDMLRFVIASGFRSALIVEDDVDWDFTVRTQMELVSDNVRSFTETPDTDLMPYGSGWDVLWIGHCGEIPSTDVPTLQYADDSVLPKKQYVGFTKKYHEPLKEGHRIVQYVNNTVCTFAYAVTSTSAPKVLEALSSGQDEGFDIALMNKCCNGNLRCISVNPEIMHHYKPKEGTGYVSLRMEGDGLGHAGEDDWNAFEKLKGTTGNIAFSARCAALFRGTCRKMSND